MDGLADLLVDQLKGEDVPTVLIPPTKRFLHRYLGANLVAPSITTKHHSITHLFDNGRSLKNRFGGAPAYGGNGKCTAYFGQCEGVLGETRYYNQTKTFATGIQYQVGTGILTTFVDLTDGGLASYIHSIIEFFNRHEKESVGVLSDPDDYTASIALNTALELLLPDQSVDGYLVQSVRTQDPDGKNILFKGRPGGALPISVDAWRVVLSSELEHLVPSHLLPGDGIEMDGKKVYVCFADEGSQEL